MRGVGVYTRELIKALKKNNSVTVCEFTNSREIPQSADLVHFSHFDPFFLTLPFIFHKPFVVTVHDLIPLVFPNHFKRGIKGEVKWQIQRWNLSRSKRIITDSISSKKDITSFIHKSPDTIDVIPLAPRSVFMKTLSLVSFKPYAVYVGDINWNKNIFGLLHAWKSLVDKKAFHSGELLYLVGHAFLSTSREAQQIDAFIQTNHLESVIKRIGFLSDEELSQLLSSSSMCVLPSYYEGFGLPVLEAMASGTIVIATHGGSLKEITGPAIICDPYNSESIAKSIRDVFSLSQKKREELVRRGREWAGKYSWKHVAENTILAYNKALGKL